MTCPQSFTLDEEDRQAVLLAISILSIERPGWVWFLGTIAEKFEGKEMYEEFRLIHCLKESDTDPSKPDLGLDVQTIPESSDPKQEAEPQSLG